MKIDSGMAAYDNYTLGLEADSKDVPKD